MKKSPRRPVLASQRSSDESSADLSDAGEGHQPGFCVSRDLFGGKFRLSAGQEGGLRMCGIIGYVGSRASKPLLLQGLKRLEYRGYDSAGIALLEDDGLDYVRAVGNLQFLKDAAGPNGSVAT